MNQSKMRLKALLTLALATSTAITFAQDVIVKHDGSVILSKVIKVGTTEVEYKKFTNQGGPTYSILKTDIQAINYENGEMDKFAESQHPVAGSDTAANNNAASMFGVNPNLAEDNLKLVREFNSHDPVYTGNDIHKKADRHHWIFGLKEGSIIETPEVKANFSLKEWYAKVQTFGHGVLEERTVDIREPAPYNTYNFQLRMAVQLKNKSTKPIYIDLANSYIIVDDQARPYYVPTATTTTQGGSSGGSVNLGAVAGAIGVGGSVGRLANGVTVGGSSTNLNTKTTYSQRVVSIPPMSSLILDPMNIGHGFTWVTATKREFNNELGEACHLKDYVPDKLLRGEIINIPQPENSPLAVYLTYSFDEDMSATQSMRIDFYIRQVMGYDVWKTKYVDLSGCPLVK